MRQNVTLTDKTKTHVISNYVLPARARGEQVLQIRVGNVARELGWTNRTPSVFSTLSSRSFQAEAGLELIEKRGGPASGGPSTTVQFVYRLLGAQGSQGVPQKIVPNGEGLLDLYGILAGAYGQLGGGEDYLKREREELSFPSEERSVSGDRA
ncbi:MAG TPA: hypothetical protein VE291_09440 [Terracidiphilus sp.]|jgi:hypothetical protein|nr:hypothetical protein [Terracidiphilus sp.]